MSQYATEQDFEDYVLANLDEAEQQIGYHFSGLRGLIGQHGAVNVAKGLVSLETLSVTHGGFQILCDHNLEHLSVEQAMIDFQKASFFSEVDISAAKAKLYLAAFNKINGGR